MYFISLILQAECQSSKEEAKDILQALEELALSHDQREAELATRDREIEEIKEQLAQASLVINGKESEVQLARDTLAAQRKKYAEVVSALIRDVFDVGECMSSQLQVSTLYKWHYCSKISSTNIVMSAVVLSLQKPNVITGDRLDEEVAVMRLYMNKMKTEAKVLHTRVNQLEEERVQNVQLLRKSEDEAKEFAIRVREVLSLISLITLKKYLS